MKKKTTAKRRSAAAPSAARTRKGGGSKSTVAPKEKALRSSARPAPKKKSPARRSAPAKAPKSAPYSEGKWASSFTPRTAGEIRYWLVKSEPESFSFDDLLAARDRLTMWDGVRNFAARNFLRDGMKIGDLVLYYHSMVDPQSIVGICEVVREGYPDSTAFDRNHAGYDESSSRDTPTWYMVDLRAVRRLARPVTLASIRAEPALAETALLRVSRLSVVPVTPAEWKVFMRLAGES